ncbi:MAG: 2-phospho-L-lactate guanylyltransferase [Nitrospinota bacterium]
MANPHPCIALIPARDFRSGKSRLADVLSDDERAELGKWMFERVLRAAGSAVGVDEIAVLSDGDSVLSITEKNGAVGIRCPARELNEDLEAGQRWALERKARTILVIPADLPALEPPDIDAMIGQGDERRYPGGCAVMVSSPDGGTNGLFIRPAGRLAFHFGPDSFARHRDAARSSHLPFISFQNLGFGLDVDTPSDLTVLSERGIPLPKWLAAISLP